MAEINYEALWLALESTAGTAVTPPTHTTAIVGTLTPMMETFRPNENRSTTHEFYRSKRTRFWSEFSGEMGLDLTLLPLLLNQIVKGNVTTPTTPTLAVLGRLWTFIDLGAGANLPKTATWYWGDPTIKVFQGAYGVLDEITITADGTGTDGSTMSISGHTQKLTALGSAPTFPALVIGGIVVPMDFQVWLDDIGAAGTIGTTALTGRVLSVEHKLTRNRSYKFIPDGPAGAHTYSNVGYGKYHMETKVSMEFPDTTQFTNFTGGSVMGLRVRHNGAFIEVVSAANTYQYVEVDTYGPFDSFAWGEYEGTNRTLEMTIISEVNSTIGSSYRIAVQNVNTAL